MLDLRPYQRTALDNIDQAERDGVRRPLVVLPTGTGKTVVFSHSIKERADRGRAFVMVHRDELARQTAEKIQIVAPELSTGIVKADQNEVHADVVIGSVQTCHRDARLAQILDAARSSPFGTVICDEAHHAPAPTWRKVLDGLGAFRPYGPLTVGFTATPERDKKSLGVWEKVVSYMSIRHAIYGDRTTGDEGGYLVPILPAVVVETNMDLDKVGRSRGGDYSEGDLGRQMEESGAIAQIADAYAEHAADRKGLVFTPTVATAHALAAALKARGIRAEALDGETEKDERRAMLRRLKTGETQVICNCGVLTEGFDEPSVSCVVVARATRFHGLYVQMVGRGTRLSPGKKDLLVLDVVGATRRHELVTLVDLEVDNPEEAKKRKEAGEQEACRICEIQGCEEPAHRCRLCHRYLPKSALTEGATRHENCRSGGAGRVDVFGTSRLRWLPVESGWCLGAGKEVVVMVPVDDDTWKLAAYQGGRIEVIQDRLPADWAMGIGEDRAKAFQKLVERDARWLKMRPTESQQSRLIREGLPAAKVPQVKTRGEAADLITRIQGRRAVRRLTTSPAGR